MSVDPSASEAHACQYLPIPPASAPASTQFAPQSAEIHSRPLLSPASSLCPVASDAHASQFRLRSPAGFLSTQTEAATARTAEGITRSCTRNRTISILARTHEYQSISPTFHLFTRSPWTLLISQCQATFPSEYSSHFVSHCKSIRDCYTLGPPEPFCSRRGELLSQECYTSTHRFPHSPRAPLALERNARGGMTESRRKDGDGKVPPGSGLSYGLVQESKEVSTDDLDHISFAISPGQEFCRKSYGVVVSFYAIVLPIGSGLREVCHLVTEVKTKPHVVSPYQIANMIDMVGHVFLVQFLFVGVPNKDTEGIHSHNPIARRQFTNQIVREISHGGDESSTVRVRGHHGPVIEMEQVFHSLIIEVADVEIHPETGGFLRHLDAKVRQPAFPPLLHRIKETSVRCIVSAAPRHPDAPHSQLVEDTQQTEIVPDGLQALERKKNGKLPLLSGVPYLLSVTT